MYSKIKAQIYKDRLPESIQEGYIYISKKHNTARHLCPCGCKKVVNTRIHPTRWCWKRHFFTRRISLYPSVSLSSFECRSHYFIIKNRIVWCRKLTDYEVEQNRIYDKSKRDNYKKQESKSIFKKIMGE